MLLIKISSLFACFVLICADSADDESRLSILTYPENYHRVETGSPLELRCLLTAHGKVWWKKNEVNITRPVSRPPATWSKDSVEIEDAGDYVCEGMTTDGNSVQKTIHVSVIESPKIPTGRVIRARKGLSAILGCNLRGPSLSDLKWEKIDEPEKTGSLNKPENIVYQNETDIAMRLELLNVDHGDNGTYECSARSANGRISIARDLLVIAAPEIECGTIKAVGANSVYLNWTVNDHNDNVTQYNIEYRKNGEVNWKPEMKEIGTGSSSFVSTGLEPGTAYRFRIKATNSAGDSKPAFYSGISTLEKDPEFVPSFTVPQTTNHSITIELSKPPADLKDFAYYYRTSVREAGNHNRETSDSGVNAERIIIEKLKPKTTYILGVAACNNYTKSCGNSSAEQEVVTVHKNVTSSSERLHPAGVIFLAINIFPLYFSVKYSIT